MNPSVDDKPTLGPEDARHLMHDRFGVSGELTELDGERDLNFKVTAADGTRYVFKVYNPAEDPEFVALQDEALDLIATAGVDGCPRPLGTETDDGSVIRLLSWVDGEPLASFRPHAAPLLRDVGRFVGRVDRALSGLHHPALDREFPWDLRRTAQTVGANLGAVEDRDRRGILERQLLRLEELAPRMADLRVAPVHNDPNDYNVLIRDGHVPGLIDFGDLLKTWIAGSAAVAVAYGILDKRDPVASARAIVGGYHETHPLEEQEAEAVWELARMRLMVSVVMSARQRQLAPDNTYLSISARAAWRTLERMSEVHPRYAAYALRDACGLPGCPAGPAVTAYLERQSPAPLVPTELASRTRHVLDLSVAAPTMGQPGESTATVATRIQREIADAGAAIGIGRYDEVRRCYVSPQFIPESDEFPERRTVHLGIDVFAPAGTAVHAPLPGTVWSVADNDGHLDYGPTLILHHRPADGPAFWTLYGHLSRSSVAEQEVGREIQRGDVLAEIGPFPENGDWPPHVHFQVITDILDLRGDFPGVAAPSLRTLWRSLCPDPSRALNLGPEAVAPAGPDGAHLRADRERHAAPSLSISYDAPLTIVAGRGAHLFDDAGQAYLDGVNNVCHVGHSHPAVTSALATQATILNTNTRYLHPAFNDYCRRLADLLPDPLEVVYLCCSGSEANELALRLARAATGRRDMVVLGSGYHGNTGNLVDLSPYKHEGSGGSGPPSWVHVAPLPDPFRGRYRNEPADVCGNYVKHVRELASAHPPAALLAESLSGCGGQVEYPPGYLKGAFDAVRAAGGVCIADEVQVGFGRVGSHWWGFQTQDVVPDIVTLGKPMGNGHPLAGVVTTRAIANRFANGMEWFNTFGGNPVSCAVGMAVLDVIENEGLRENAARIGAHLKAGLIKLQDRHPLIGDVRGRGLFLGAELVSDRRHLEPATDAASWVVNRMRHLGYLLSTDGPDANVIKIKPPLVWTADDANGMLAALDRALEEQRHQP